MVKRTFQKAGQTAGLLLAGSVLALSTGFMPLARMLVAAGGYGATPLVGSGDAATTNLAQPITDLSLDDQDTSESITANVSVDSGSLSLPANASGITYFQGTSSGVSVTLSGTVADINTALAALTYTGTIAGSDTLYLSVLPSANAFYAPTKHMYTYSSAGKTWSQAGTYAGSQTLNGQSGYLATITTRNENATVLPLITNNINGSWLGATDTGHLGTWQWTTGPEAGSTVGSNGQFTDYMSTYPQDIGGQASCVALQGDEYGHNIQWRTAYCTVAAAYRPGTLVEYDESSAVSQDSEAITVTNPQSGGSSSSNSGTGTVHTVSNCTELQSMDADSTTYLDTFKLTADIDCQNMNFIPLFWGQGPFEGTFNGQGHSISGLSIGNDPDNPISDAVGLFSYVSGATIENLTLASGDGVYSADDGDGYSGYAGALAGEADDSTITNVVSHLNVSSDDNEAGGLIGDVEAGVDGGDSVISGSAATGTVSGYGYVGGLVGYAGSDDASVTVERSYATGNVSAQDSEAGGLIGETDAGYDSSGNIDIHDVYAWGDVDASNGYFVGGLIGEVETYNAGSDFSLTNAYASGTVIGQDEIGGLLGSAGYDGDDGAITLSHVFSAAQLNVLDGDPYDYGFIIGSNAGGGDGGTASGTDLYYDSANSGIDDPSYDATCDYDENISDSDCTDVNSDGTHDDYFLGNHVNAPMDSWDFATIWTTNTAGLPTFRSVGVDDNDGVSPAMEDAAPNTGDANSDGTMDSQQPNVSSFVTSQTGQYVAVAAPDSCNLASVSSVAETANTVQDGSYDYPEGMVNYTANCATNGYAASMQLYFFGASKAGLVLRKYDPVTNSYDDVPGATLSDVTIGGQSAVLATYTITDGGPLDADGTANGVIVDPVGLARSTSLTNSTTNGTSTNGSSLSDTGVNIMAAAGMAAALTVLAWLIKRYPRKPNLSRF